MGRAIWIKTASMGHMLRRGGERSALRVPSRMQGGAASSSAPKMTTPSKWWKLNNGGGNQRKKRRKRKKNQSGIGRMAVGSGINYWDFHEFVSRYNYGVWMSRFIAKYAVPTSDLFLSL